MISYLVEMMLPFSDLFFTTYIHNKILPHSRDSRALLGPVLTSRVILYSPLLDWLDENNNALFLPEGIESCNYTDVQRARADWDARFGE